MNGVQPYPRTWIELNLENLRHNLAVVKRDWRPGQLLALVCKADAYGHGLVPIGRFAAQNGADWLAVATVQEGVALRDAGVDVPIMVMSPVLTIEADQAVFYQLDIFVESSEMVEAVSRAAVHQGRTGFVHIKVDTGLHRFGVQPDGVAALLNTILTSKQVELRGIAQHYIDSLNDPERTAQQTKAFEACLAKVPSGTLVHAANSAAARHLGESGTSLARVGIHAYGLAPGGRFQDDLRPVMTWRARLTSLRRIAQGETVSYSGTWQADRPSLIGTLGVGYGDGYPRSLSSKGVVWMAGQRCPIVGLVCMDQMMIDLTDFQGNPQIGDVVELLGENLLATELAKRAGTNTHEIVTRIMTRVSRRYLHPRSGG
ncbi:MAG: alanine racemase [Armatimonadetes bacterium]|nr:alanine racemase [Armatimonadota bacterium]